MTEVKAPPRDDCAIVNILTGRNQLFTAIMRCEGSLIWRLFGLILGVCALFAALLAYLVYQALHQAQSNAIRSADAFAVAVAQDISGQFRDINRYLEYLAEHQVATPDKTRCEPVLEGREQRKHHLANVLVTDAEGRPVCSGIKGPGLPPQTFASFAWHQQATQAEGLSVSKPFTGPISQREVIAVSRPLRDGAGRRLGLVTVLLDLSALRSELMRFPLPVNSVLTIAGADGADLVSSPGLSQQGAKNGPPELSARPIDSVERVITSKAIPLAHWTVIVAIPADQVFAEYNALIQRSLLAIVAVVLTVLTLAFVQARRMVAPLKDLAQTARAVAQGNLQLRAAAAAPGELGLVAREFNAMLDSRQLAEVALRESERRYGDLLDHVDMVSLMVDASGQITYCNDYLVSLTGWRRSELLGASWLDKLIPMERVDVRATFTRAMSGEGSFVRHDEFEVTTRAGARKLIQWHNSLLYSSEGTISGMAALGVDVTEANDSRARELRHVDFYAALSRTNRAIVRLPDEQSLYKEVCRICVEHGHASISYVSLVEGDALVQVASAGPAAAFLSGLRIQREGPNRIFSGLTGAAVTTGLNTISNNCEDDPRMAKWHDTARVIGTKSIAAFPFRRNGATVGALTLHMTSAGFFDERVVSLVDEMAVDVSFALDNLAREADRREVGRRLQHQERQLSGLVETAMDAIISLDVDHKIVLFNRAASELFRVPTDQAIGSDIERFIPPGLRARHRQHVQRFALTGTTTRRMGVLHELVGIRSDGTEFPLEASISRLDEGAASLLTVVIRDATGAKEAEQARMTQAAAESSSRAKTAFLSKMSHELRTPLNAVIGFSQLLLGDAKEPLPPKHVSLVEHVRAAGWHLLSLVNDVLDVSQIEAGAVTVELRSVDVVELLNEARQLNDGAARARQVQIVPKYLEHTSAVVLADPRRLRQVLINILSNAIKYNVPGGQVEINVRQQEDTTSIVVEDTGQGMDETQMAHLFEPFNRLGRENEDVEGTGLGLLLTRELVQLMNGSLTLTSKAGVGTRVQITLNGNRQLAGERPVAEEVDRSLPEQVLPAGRVLYIEDNSVNRLLVERLLQRWPDVLLLQAGTGQEGLELARSGNPDVILLDMRLPDMDGSQVLAELAGIPHLQRCPVVALSASAMPNEVRAAQEAGAADYWTKPIDFPRFLSGMERLLREVQ